MDNVTYEPIRDDLEIPATRADLYSLYQKLESLYGREKERENVIELDN
jgi:hypothetical protein